MDLDTAGLRALILVAEEAHFGRAATRLGISQQAVSKRIHRLEERLGAVVLRRNGPGGVRLTAVGHQTLLIARRVIADVDRLDPLVGPDQGRLRVDVLGEVLAPAEWLRSAAAKSGLPIDLVQRPPEATAEQLLVDGRAAVAFGRAGAVPQPWPTGLHRRLARLEPIALLVPPDHPWASLDAVPFASLAGSRIWFPMTSAPIEWRDLVAELQEASGLQVDTTGSSAGYRRWAEEVTSGVAPPSLIGEGMAAPNAALRSVPIVDPVPVFPWWLLWSDAIGPDDLDSLLRCSGLAAAPSRGGGGIWMPAADAALLDAD